MKKQIKGHQGDVQFKTVKYLPKDAKRITNKPIALGKHSGHMHIITGPKIEMFELDGKIFTVVGSDGARLQHIHESKLTTTAWTSTQEIEVADHKSHFLPEGIYEFFIQNAYNPYSKLMEKVID
jgi:hypothetical protein